MKNFFKRNYKSIIIVLLLILTIITGYYSYKLKEKYENSLNNDYNESFGEAVNCINNVENFLAKAMLSKSSNIAVENLTQIWKEANLAMVYLSRIPFDSENQSQTIKFLNQVSDYSYALSRKNTNKEDLTDEDFKNLEELNKYCLELENTLNQLEEELYSGQISWDSLNTAGKGLNFAQEVDNVSVFSSIENNFNEYEGLIYDGAYSEHISHMEKKGLTGEDITEEQAKEKIGSFFNDEIENITSNGFIENADIPVYDFTVKVKNHEKEYGIEISKKGGWIVALQNDRNVEEEKIGIQDANQIGKEFLNKIGFSNMKETYYTNLENILTVNYAYVQDDIVIYPDLIKVKIALDNGEVLGCETSGYLNAHYKREIKKAKITIEEARQKLNDKLNIISESTAIIPTEWKTEKLCYEFKGTVSNKEFLVYINVETGEEEDILVILETEGGTLTI
ncbi:MAG: germination protein YpeB [Candidatus Scatovivens sp.]